MVEVKFTGSTGHSIVFATPDVMQIQVKSEDGKDAKWWVRG